MNESDQADMTCPHCGSPYPPRTGWAVTSANQFVPTITCSACGQPWTMPAKPARDSELRAKLEALATEYEGRSLHAWNVWLEDTTMKGQVVASKVWHWAADDIRQLLAEDSTQEVNK